MSPCVQDDCLELFFNEGVHDWARIQSEGPECIGIMRDYCIAHANESICALITCPFDDKWSPFSPCQNSSCIGEAAWYLPDSVASAGSYCEAAIFDYCNLPGREGDAGCRLCPFSKSDLTSPCFARELACTWTLEPPAACIETALEYCSTTAGQSDMGCIALLSDNLFDCRFEQHHSYTPCYFDACRSLSDATTANDCATFITTYCTTIGESDQGCLKSCPLDDKSATSPCWRSECLISEINNAGMGGSCCDAYVAYCDSVENNDPFCTSTSLKRECAIVSRCYDKLANGDETVSEQ